MIVKLKYLRVFQLVPFWSEVVPDALGGAGQADSSRQQDQQHHVRSQGSDPDHLESGILEPLMLRSDNYISEKSSLYGVISSNSMKPGFPSGLTLQRRRGNEASGQVTIKLLDFEGKFTSAAPKVVGPCARSARIATTILLVNPAVKPQCLLCTVVFQRGDLLCWDDVLLVTRRGFLTVVLVTGVVAVVGGGSGGISSGGSPSPERRSDAGLSPCDKNILCSSVRPLLDIGLSHGTPLSTILGHSHPALASRPAKIIAPPSLRTSYATFADPWSPLKNSSTPTLAVEMLRNSKIEVPIVPSFSLLLILYWALLRLPRFCSASGMFADAGVEDFYAVMRKKSTSIIQRVRGSGNRILQMIADRLDSAVLGRFMDLHVRSGDRSLMSNLSLCAISSAGGGFRRGTACEEHETWTWCGGRGRHAHSQQVVFERKKERKKENNLFITAVTHYTGTYLIIQVVDMFMIWGNLPLMTGTAFLLFTNLAQATKIASVVVRRRTVGGIIADADQMLRGEEGRGREIVQR
ncbi:hypothetical protein MSG28_010040 [Choristoneura fumiferana]|uniref:Uncharacterized protein n=1 Tax=Choristoneura fumiferana TaxID=7141 RepID=A0ACC0KK23_CHOFU|nr:hypothetical protein MSG28_010040 [Choristoneura fumiferana]